MPALVDLAAMRDAIQRLGGNPDKINPLVKSMFLFLLVLLLFLLGI